MVGAESVTARHLAAFRREQAKPARQDRPMLGEGFNCRLGSCEQGPDRLDRRGAKSCQLRFPARPVKLLVVFYFSVLCGPCGMGYFPRAVGRFISLLKISLMHPHRDQRFVIGGRLTVAGS